MGCPRAPLAFVTSMTWCWPSAPVRSSPFSSTKVASISSREPALKTRLAKGLGYSMNVPNVPLHPYTEDEVFTWAFRQVVLPLLRIFQPTIIVTQLGVGTFRTDPLSDLELTTAGFCSMIEAFRDLNVPWVALGEGGDDVPNVPRAWTLA